MRVAPLPVFFAAAVCLAVVAGCKAVATTTFPQCTLDATLTPDQGTPGDVITATGGEFSEPYDTVITVGGTASTVGDVTRTGCSLCDLCRQAAADVNECDACQTCFQCASYCDTCEQALTFVVPDVAAGAVAVVITNRYGSTDALPFVVLGGADTGDTGTDTGDTGADTGDTGTDTGTTDTGTTDTGATDTGATDTGTTDTGTTDTGADTGTSDTAARR